MMNGDRFRQRLSLLGPGLLVVALVLGAASLAACGEAAEDPDDCVAGEFFDDGIERCVACPAIVEPECRPGCGFRIVEDNRGCPAAECAEQCDICEAGEFFSEDSLSCEACAEANDPPAICAEDDG